MSDDSRALQQIPESPTDCHYYIKKRKREEEEEEKERKKENEKLVIFQ